MGGIFNKNISRNYQYLKNVLSVPHFMEVSQAKILL